MPLIAIDANRGSPSFRHVLMSTARQATDTPPKEYVSVLLNVDIFLSSVKTPLAGSVHFGNIKTAGGWEDRRFWEYVVGAVHSPSVVQ